MTPRAGTLRARKLREAVCEANLDLVASGLVISTFGNVSGADREEGFFAIKPSGVSYDGMLPRHMVLVSIDTGEVIDGDLRPSSDTPTHLELYRAYESIGGIAHTHSEFATAFAQAGKSIACMGTTHADYFHGDVPVTRALTRSEVESAYERNTGLVIVETLEKAGLSADEMPGALVLNHGPFAWGADPEHAVEHARILEYLARMEFVRQAIADTPSAPEAYLVDKHFRRKHGPAAYYGQR